MFFGEDAVDVYMFCQNLLPAIEGGLIFVASGGTAGKAQAAHDLRACGRQNFYEVFGKPQNVH